MVAEVIDLYCDGEPTEPFPTSRCQRGTAVFAVPCPFCSTQDECEAGENVSELRGLKCTAARFRILVNGDFLTLARFIFFQ
jgi:hypothetical protein